MRGHILLEGGAEFGGLMSEPDRRALDLAGGRDATVCIIPAAAAPDQNHERAGQTGVRWFQQLGASQVTLLPLIDRASANQSSVVLSLANARLIYLLGGFPAYLGRTLMGSLSWQAILEAYQSGAVIGGSSAGAMVLCQHCYDPDSGSIVEGLNLIPNACVIPHHDTLGKGWVSQLASLLPDDVLIGIDEQTGMLDDAGDGDWKVYGKGVATLYKEGTVKTCHSAQRFSL
jgi:cyanophycinase